MSGVNKKWTGQGVGVFGQVVCEAMQAFDAHMEKNGFERLLGKGRLRVEDTRGRARQRGDFRMEWKALFVDRVALGKAVRRVG